MTVGLAGPLLPGLLLVLGGCLAGPQAPAGLPLDEDGDPLPTLHGIVVDAAIRPLPGVVVRFLGLDGVETTTDEGGRYEIRRPTVRAEGILVTASKEGFVAKTQQSQVSGHRSIRLDFVLEADPSIVPRVDVLQFSGLARCLAAVTAAGESGGIGCAPDRGNGADPIPDWMWDINPAPGLAGVVVEVHWEPMTAASTTMHAWLTAPMAGGQGGEVQAEATGPSPLRLEIPAEAAGTFGRWTAVRLHVELAGEDAGLARAGVSHEQRFDAYASLFYVDAAPSGYTIG